MPRPPARFQSRRRLLAIGKWAGLCLCIAIAGVWVATRWYRASTGARVHNGWGGMQVSNGQAFIVWASGSSADQFALSNGEYFAAVHRLEEAPGWLWEWHWSYHRFSNGPLLSIWIPLWAPFLLAAAPTALMWWRSRRPAGGPGHCRCGYSLAGLEGQPCPECGRGAG